MFSIAEVIEKVVQQQNIKKVVHWKQDIANLIMELSGGNSHSDLYKKNYVQILVMLKRSGYAWGDMMYLLQKSDKLPSKYSKVGFIINKLKEAGKLRKKYVQTNRIQSSGNGSERGNSKRASGTRSVPKADKPCCGTLF